MTSYGAHEEVRPVTPNTEKEEVSPADADKDSADNADTERKMAFLTSGVSEGGAAWNLIKSETRKPIKDRQFKRRKALKDHCKGLGTGWQAFERLYEEAEKLPGFIPFKGKPIIRNKALTIRKCSSATNCVANPSPEV